MFVTAFYDMQHKNPYFKCPSFDGKTLFSKVATAKKVYMLSTVKKKRDVPVQAESVNLFTGD